MRRVLLDRDPNYTPADEEVEQDLSNQSPDDDSDDSSSNNE